MEVAYSGDPPFVNPIGVTLVSAYSWDASSKILPGIGLSSGASGAFPDISSGLTSRFSLPDVPFLDSPDPDVPFLDSSDPDFPELVPPEPETVVNDLLDFGLLESEFSSFFLPSSRIESSIPVSSGHVFSILFPDDMMPCVSL